MAEMLVWVIPEIGRMRVGASRASLAPLPFGADVITRCEEQDKDLMIKWIKRKAKQGLSAEQMRAACERDSAL